jgi:hypothetical protein
LGGFSLQRKATEASVYPNKTHRPAVDWASYPRIYKEVLIMEKRQTIGCDVVSCAYNHEGVRCDLDHIEVSCCGDSCGRENESLSASYRCESENE